MLWLSRPPYLRWAAITLIVGVSLWVDFGPKPGVDHPYAARDLDPGEEIDQEDVDWRRIPTGILPPVSLPAITGGPVGAGEPLRPSDLSEGGAPTPEGWWAVEVEVPLGTPAGSEVRLTLTDVVTGITSVVPGIVTQVVEPESAFVDGSVALVAVPEEHVGGVASARLEGRLGVAIRR